MARHLSPMRRIMWPFYYVLRSMLELRVGNRKAALENAEQALSLAREVDLPTYQLPHFLGRVAMARSALGDHDRAMAAIEEAIVISPPQKRTKFERWRAIFAIEADLHAGEVDSAAARLATVLADLRMRGDYIFMRSWPELGARLANLALERGIETEYVRTVIDKESLVAPPDVGPAWPFRLRVRVLGAFELVRDGEPMRFSGKTQQRPLELLKFIVSLGGRDVDAEYLTGTLWPDSDGEAANRAFESALFRLRKLLDVEGAVQLAAGKLSLARSLVWTDVSSFEAAVDHAADEAAPVTQRARRLLDAYPGRLLGEDESPWIAKPRDSLRARFVRSLLELGEQLERQRDFAAAIDVYRRGLEADNLAEAFYRGLMRSLVATGDRAEAVNAFRRCRELLSIVLGLTPSAETDRLYRDIATTRSASG
jgi:DNA-binding SARP family transcriptional activator